MKMKRGSTSVRRLIFIADSSSTTGAGLANLTNLSAGLTAYYFAGDLSNEVAISIVSATLGAYTSGGFVAVDNTNMPGWYEIGIPNAALDGGNEVAIQYRGATNMVPVNIYIELDAFDYQTASAAQTGDAYAYLGTNVGANGTSMSALITDLLATEVDSSGTPVTVNKVLEMLAAFAAGKVSVSSAAGVSTYSFKKRDGTAVSFTSVCSETDGTRSTTGALS